MLWTRYSPGFQASSEQSRRTPPDANQKKTDENVSPSPLPSLFLLSSSQRICSGSLQTDTNNRDCHITVGLGSSPDNHSDTNVKGTTSVVPQDATRKKQGRGLQPSPQAFALAFLSVILVGDLHFANDATRPDVRRPVSALRSGHHQPRTRSRRLCSFPDDILFRQGRLHRRTPPMALQRNHRRHRPGPQRRPRQIAVRQDHPHRHQVRPRRRPLHLRPLHLRRPPPQPRTRRQGSQRHSNPPRRPQNPGGERNAAAIGSLPCSACVFLSVIPAGDLLHRTATTAQDLRRPGPPRTPPGSRKGLSSDRPPERHQKKTGARTSVLAPRPLHLPFLLSSPEGICFTKPPPPAKTSQGRDHHKRPRQSEGPISR
jgi:hypothetical protein